MKIKKLAAGLLAAAVAFTSMPAMPAWADSSVPIVVPSVARDKDGKDTGDTGISAKKVSKLQVTTTD